MDIFNLVRIWTEILSYYPLFIECHYIYNTYMSLVKLIIKIILQLWYVNDIETLQKSEDDKN